MTVHYPQNFIWSSPESTVQSQNLLSRKYTAISEFTDLGHGITGHNFYYHSISKSQENL